MPNSAANVIPDFAARVRALPPDAWTRMADRVPELEGDRMAALLARSDRIADAARVVPGIPRLLSKPLIVMGQLVAEFRAPAASRTVGRWTRGSARLTPGNRRMVEGLRDLTELMDSKRVDHPGVVAAFQAVVMALPLRERLAAGEFERLYAFVEPEIPLDSLKADDDAA